MSHNPVCFQLPEALNAAAPPERRGLRRDFVRMLVLARESGRLVAHSEFYRLPNWLRKGDVLVLNSSRTVPAALKAQWRRNGRVLKNNVKVRLAAKIGDSVWKALIAGIDLKSGDMLHFYSDLQAKAASGQIDPFCMLHFNASGIRLHDQIYRLGEPIRYEYIRRPWNLDYYQTVYGDVPGSVEMPSAGRAFSWELLLSLRRKGVRIAFVQLHTGLSYLSEHLPQLAPDDNYESYTVPQAAVEAIETARRTGGRVIAVGTTVVRALESAASDGRLLAQSGLTNLYIHAGYPLQVTDGLITGLHEPEASHLEMLSAFIAPDLLKSAYLEAIREGYLWHEFGDMNLIL